MLGLSGPDAAAWAQAYLSALAIVVSVMVAAAIPMWERRTARRNARQGVYHASLMALMSLARARAMLAPVGNPKLPHLYPASDLEAKVDPQVMKSVRQTLRVADDFLERLDFGLLDATFMVGYVFSARAILALSIDRLSVEEPQELGRLLEFLETAELNLRFALENLASLLRAAPIDLENLGTAANPLGFPVSPEVLGRFEASQAPLREQMGVAEAQLDATLGEADALLKSTSCEDSIGATPQAAPSNARGC
jgi:hypothetical protein